MNALLLPIVLGLLLVSKRAPCRAALRMHGCPRRLIATTVLCLLSWASAASTLRAGATLLDLGRASLPVGIVLACRSPSLSFVVDSFEEEPPFLEDPGVKYARARIANEFRGDIEARALSRCSRCGPTAAAQAMWRWSGSRVRCTAGRGNFALLHVGTMAGESQWARWPVVPGSGTGELARIAGEARIEIGAEGDHQLHLDYEFS